MAAYLFSLLQKNAIRFNNLYKNQHCSILEVFHLKVNLFCILSNGLTALLKEIFFITKNDLLL
jgi:hypothetical protein